MIPELPHRIAPLREHLQGHWTPLRQERVWKNLQKQPGRGQRIPVRLALAACVMASVAALWLAAPAFWPAGEVRGAAGEVDTPVVLATHRFQDGSLLTPAVRGTVFITEQDDPSITRVILRSGEARFQINHRDPTRPFEVLAKQVKVQVIGTVFRVAVEPGGVRVRVEDGVVRVDTRAPVRERLLRELRAGEQLFVADAANVGGIEHLAALPGASSDSAAPAADSAAPAADSAAPAADSAAPAADSAAPDPALRRTSQWRARAQSGDFPAALEELDREGAAAVRDDPTDLLLAADAARLGGRPDRAVRWLETVVRRHPRSSLAPLAAFTLGRVLLEQLGRPSEAARAFITAQKLGPGGALAEDALAREVESWSRAGDATTAQQRGEEYVQRYPNGRRLKAVRAHAGLETPEAADPGNAP